MSETVLAGCANVRILLREDDPADYWIDTITLSHLLVSRAQEWGHPLVLGLVNTASMITLTVDSSADYALTSGINYESVVTLWLPAIGRELVRVSMDAINWMRNGILSTTKGSGDPSHYALYLNQSSVPAVRINCVPSFARTVDVLHSETIATSASSDDNTYPLRGTPRFLRAVEKSVAADVINMMPARVVEERAFGPNTQRDFAVQAEVGRKRAMESAHRMMTQGERLETRTIIRPRDVMASG